MQEIFGVVSKLHTYLVIGIHYKVSLFHAEHGRMYRVFYFLRQRKKYSRVQ